MSDYIKSSTNSMKKVFFFLALQRERERERERGRERESEREMNRSFRLLKSRMGQWVSREDRFHKSSGFEKANL